MSEHRRVIPGPSGSVVLLGALLSVATGSSPAWAQADTACSALGLYLGVATSHSGPTATGGAAATWGITPRLGAEARMSWFDRPAGEERMAASLSAQFRLPTSSRRVPFFRAGLGAHMATFDLAEVVPPEFYGRRIADGVPGERRTFTDPALVFGGGVDILAHRFLSWRPEIEAHIVWHGSHTYTVMTASVQVSWHFEPHRVTPATSGARTRGSDRK